MSKQSRKRKRKHSDNKPNAQQNAVVLLPTEPADKNPAEIGNTHENKSEEFAQMTPKKGHASWREWLKSSITSDRVMAAFTVVIAFVAVLQWRVFAAQRDVFAAQLDEMRIDQRAWLAVKPNLIQPQINSPVVAPTVVTNTGKTPAKNIHGWVFVQRVPKNTAIDFSNPTYTEPPKVEQGEPIPVNIKFNIGVLFPNDPTSLNEVAMRRQDAVGIPFVEIIWTQTMQEQYDRGEFYLNVRARFTYDDAAGKAHWTQFCRIATAPGQAASVPNHTSEQCMAWTTIDDKVSNAWLGLPLTTISRARKQIRTLPG